MTINVLMVNNTTTKPLNNNNMDERNDYSSIPEQLSIKPLNYVYVAMHVEFAKPIVTSNTMEGMFEAIDDYMGPNSKRLTWYPYDCKYPDSYQGHVEYRDEDDEIQTIKIYDVEFFNKQQQ